MQFGNIFKLIEKFKISKEVFKVSKLFQRPSKVYQRFSDLN